MKKYILFLILVASLFLMGCVLYRTTITKEKSTERPSLSIKYDEYIVDIINGAYKWTYKEGLLKNRTEVVDIEAANNLAHTLVANNVSKNYPLTLEFNKKPNEVLVYSWDGNIRKDYKIVDNILYSPNQQGTYVFEIIGKWDQGECAYIIKLNVE